MKILSRMLLLLLLLSTAWEASASDESRLFMVGLNLFPNIVSIDQEIAEKRADDGKIYLLVVYEHESFQVIRLAERLSKQVTSIKSFATEVVAVKASKLSSFSKRAAGVFLAEKISDDLLEQVISHTRKTSTLLFSPIPGDVERGVTMGMQITSKIWPYCNTSAMEASNIHFHPSFLKIMRCYND